jgi:hypothetical protein
MQASKRGTLAPEAQFVERITGKIALSAINNLDLVQPGAVG